jgi:hypothetical protein
MNCYHGNRLVFGEGGGRESQVRREGSSGREAACGMHDVSWHA